MKLYRFRYSPYSRKVQILLDLMGRRYECVEVPYANRTELATVTGGEAPTLADAALYGCGVMIEEAEPELLARIDGALPAWLRRVEAAAPLAATESR